MNEPEYRLKEYWDSLPEDQSMPGSLATVEAVAHLAGARDAFLSEGEFPKTIAAINTGLDQLITLYLENEELKRRLNEALAMAGEHEGDCKAMIRHLSGPLL